MRLLFIGQAPSKETDGKPPFTGRCGKFLAELLGIDQVTMLAQHDFVNVLDYWPGKGINGDKFPMLEARARAKEKVELTRGRTTVLLGHNVARAFAMDKFKYFQRYETHDPKGGGIICPCLVIIPHPSGVNRLYNNLETRMAAAKTLRVLAAHAPIDFTPTKGIERFFPPKSNDVLRADDFTE